MVCLIPENIQLCSSSYFLQVNILIKANVFCMVTPCQALFQVLFLDESVRPLQQYFQVCPMVPIVQMSQLSLHVVLSDLPKVTFGS